MKRHLLLFVMSALLGVTFNVFGVTPITVKPTSDELVSCRWTPFQFGFWPGKDGQVCSGTADVKGFALCVFGMQQESAASSFSILNGLKRNYGLQIGIVTETEQNDGVALGPLVSAARVNEFFQMGILCIESGPKRQDAKPGVQFGLINYGNCTQFGLININPNGFRSWYMFFNYTSKEKKIEQPVQAIDRLKIQQQSNDFCNKLGTYLTETFPKWTKEEKLEFIIGAFPLTDAHSTEMLMLSAVKYDLLPDLREHAVSNKDEKLRSVINSYIAQNFWEYETAVSLDSKIDIYINERYSDVRYVFHTNLKFDSTIAEKFHWENSDLVFEYNKSKITFRYDDRFAVWYECADGANQYNNTDTVFEAYHPGMALVNVSYDKDGKKLYHYCMFKLVPEKRSKKLPTIDTSFFVIEKVETTEKRKK